jgi:hypothetical protein
MKHLCVCIAILFISSFFLSSLWAAKEDERNTPSTRVVSKKTNSQKIEQKPFWKKKPSKELSKNTERDAYLRKGRRGAFSE